MDTTTGAIKDKFLAGGAALVLLVCYMLLKLNNFDTAFIENALLFMLGVFGGLLKQTPTPQTAGGDIVDRKVEIGGEAK